MMQEKGNSYVKKLIEILEINTCNPMKNILEYKNRQRSKEVKKRDGHSVWKI